MDKKNYIIRLALFTLAFLAIFGWSWLKPEDEYSSWERRMLASKPEFSIEGLENGSFINEFEAYTLDQFPMRDRLRSLKALVEYDIFMKKDNNQLYIKDGNISKILYPLNEDSVNYSIEHFRKINEKYLEKSQGKVYFALIPDKHFFLGDGYPMPDYDKLWHMLEEGMDFALNIDIRDTLDGESYYLTDSHWRQERLIDTANRLLVSMGMETIGEEDFEKKIVKDDFKGVYYGQAAIPFDSEKIYILDNQAIRSSKAYHIETGKEKGIYDLEALNGKDPYDVFLSGASPIIKIESPLSKSDKKLIVFRDSFGSSLVPLLLTQYKEITVVDTRYVQSQYLEEFMEFEGQDVLFIYGTTLINNSYTLR